MKKTPDGIRNEVLDAVRIIRTCRPLVQRVGDVRVPPGKAPFCEVDFEVPLGTQIRATGVGQHGVKALETVTFHFTPWFPFKPPLIFLRPDFDRSLAHIQPGSVGHPPQPCLVDGDLAEFYQSQGLVGVVEQVGAWLRDAANGLLIDPKQGWEPVRRDSLKDRMVCDIDQIRSVVTRNGGYQVRWLSFARIRSDTGEADYQCTVADDTAHLNEDELKEFGVRQVGRVEHGNSLALVIWPGKTASGAPLVTDHYLPETVTDVATLRQRAVEYQCHAGLQECMNRLETIVRRFTSKSPIPLLIVFAVRRPYHLIGTSSEIELCPYLIEVDAPKLMPADEMTPVRPVAPEERLTSGLLARMSGRGDKSPRLPWAQFGAGSLGSKIAIHLARAGAAPASIVDRGWLSPRNAARHALTLPADRHEFHWNQEKASALAGAVEALGGECNAHTVDLATVAQDKDTARRIVPTKAIFAVNSTASLTVREALEACAGSNVLPRIVETSLFAAGAVGLITLEGPERNPSTGELITDLYAQLADDAELREALSDGAAGFHRVEIGQGCGSMTMPIPDARISLQAATMAAFVLDLHDNGLPHEGLILVGRTARDGMSVDWRRRSVAATHDVRLIGNLHGWRVRVLDRAHRKILEDVEKWPYVETGGILVGRISHAARVIYVADLVAAPPDSARSANEFHLGTNGAKEAITAYGSSTARALYCVGTWHSHLSDSNPSEQDEDVARTIALSRLVPSVVLVCTPKGYRGLIAAQEVSLPEPQEEVHG